MNTLVFQGAQNSSDTHDRLNQSWLRPAILLVLLVTTFRVLALAFVRADLFVDEAQYWLWSQTLDFGYYSKPPLIAWVIRLTTDLIGSDSAFAIRLAGPILHGGTALILGAVAADIGGGRAGLAAVAIYALAPFAAVGSLMISTDTVMAPQLALALWLILRAAAQQGLGLALLAGLMIGLAFLGKYAAVYLLLGVFLAGRVSPQFRLGLRGNIALLAGFLLAAAPNLVWNLSHDLTTIDHTVDNVGWLRSGMSLSLGSLGDFVLSQFAVFGPFSLGALLLASVGARRNSLMLGLVILSGVPLLVVAGQALVGTALANWALAAYFPGTVAAALVLRGRFLGFSMALGGLVAVALPILAITAPAPLVDGQPLLARWLGRHEFSRDILALAQSRGLPLYAESREVLADLHYTGRDSALAIYAPRRSGRPMNFYEQTLALPQGETGLLLAVLAVAPVCNGQELQPIARPNTRGGAYAHRHFAIYQMPASCLGDK